jgi:hypothetical protein
MSDSSKGYQFTLNGNTVTAVYEVERGRVEFERIDSDETWSFDGTNVSKTEWDDGRQEITTYSDANGDGLFFKTSKTYAGTSSDSGRDDDHDHGSGDNDDRSDDHGTWGDSTPSLDATLYGEEGYQFDIDANGAVTAVYEVEHGRVKAERMDWNETWAFDGLDVIQTETKFGKVETGVYTDANQDGVFQKDFELEVLTGENLRTLETYKFSLADGSNVKGDFAAEGDTITGMMELGRRGWKVDRIDANETLQVVEVDGDNLILKTKTQWNGEIDFSVFRDDDNDGRWTAIADGETLDAFVTLDGEVDLVGIVDAGLLQAADGLIA